MTIAQLIDQLKSDLSSNQECMFITRWQATASSRHDYDPETFVFCEIIIAKENKRSIIRLSGGRIKSDEVPCFLTIDVLHIIFRNPSYPNIHKQENKFKTIFNGYLTNDGKESEFSYPMLLGILNSINGFF